MSVYNVIQQNLVGENRGSDSTLRKENESIIGAIVGLHKGP